MTTKAYNKHKELIEAWANGAEIEWYDHNLERWKIANEPCWIEDTKYRIKPEFTYPMWFQSSDTLAIVKFYSLNDGVVVVGSKVHKKGFISTNWEPHTNNIVWTQIEEPKESAYPMWFKAITSDLVVRFTDLKKGEVVIGDKDYKKGDSHTNWISHTDTEEWIQVEEPKEEKILYEWIYVWKNKYTYISNRIMTEEEADKYFSGSEYTSYKKTGREF